MLVYRTEVTEYLDYICLRVATGALSTAQFSSEWGLTGMLAVKQTARKCNTCSQGLLLAQEAVRQKDRRNGKQQEQLQAQGESECTVYRCTPADVLLS